MVNVRKITEREFDEIVVRGSRRVMVEFYAPWCGPCKALQPVVDEAALAFDGEVEFYKVNVDVETELAARLEVLSVPTLIFFREGEERFRSGWMGRREDLYVHVQKLLQ